MYILEFESVDYFGYRRITKKCGEDIEKRGRSKNSEILLTIKEVLNVTGIRYLSIIFGGRKWLLRDVAPLLSQIMCMSD